MTNTTNHYTDTPEKTGRKAAFNVLLDPAEFEMLEAMANLEARSKGSVIRMLIRRAYAMKAGGTACCADGSPCQLLNRTGILPPLQPRRQ